MGSLLQRLQSFRSDTVSRTWLACATLSFLWAAYFAASVITLFYTDVVGLSVAVALLVPAWMNAVSAVGEIPLGYIADRMGVRRAMSHGLWQQVFQACLLAFWARTLWQCLLVVTLNAVSWSFTNGTTIALMDTILPSKEERGRYKRHQTVAQHAGALVGALVGGIAAAMSDSLALPVQLQPITFVAGLCVLLLIPKGVDQAASARKQMLVAQNRRFTAEVKELVGSASHVLRVLIVQNKHTRWLLAFDACLYAGVLAAAWLVQIVMDDAGVPREVFPLIFIVQTAVGLTLALTAGKVLAWKTERHLQAAMWLAVALSCSLLSYTALPHIEQAVVYIAAPAVYASIAFHGAFSTTLASDAISEVPEIRTHRTTAQSVHGALRAAVFVPMFALGKFAEKVSAAGAFAALGLFVFLGCGNLLLRYLRATRPS
jgi:hypothetical protein